MYSSKGLVLTLNLLFYASLIHCHGFNPLVRIGTNIDNIDNAAFLVDATQDPSVVFTSGGRIFYSSGSDGFTMLNLIYEADDPNKILDLPAIASNSVGVTYIVFREKDEKGGNHILWTNNRGGEFKPPQPVPGSECDICDDVSIFVLMGDEALLSWSQTDFSDPKEGTIFLSMNGEEPEHFSLGTDVSFQVDKAGIIHIAFIRSGNLFYSNSGGGGFSENEIQLTVTPETTEFSPVIELTSLGKPFIQYFSRENEGNIDNVEPDLVDGNPQKAGGLNNNQVYLLSVEDKNPELLVEGDVSPGTVSFKMFPDSDTYYVSYVKDGSIWIRFGIIGSGSQSYKASEAFTDEKFLDLAFDEASNIHLIRMRPGELYYMNNTIPPVADFTTSTILGEYPLKVDFINQSKGYFLKQYWDFGDGEHSLLANPTHEYQRQGVYSVNLRIVGTAGASSEIIKQDLVHVLSKKNHLYIPEMIVYAGQKDLNIPVRITNDMPIQGFQLAGRYDSEKMLFSDPDNFADFENTVSEKLKPEYVAPSCFPDEGVFTLGVVFDFLAPFEGKSIPPGTDRNLINLVVNINMQVGNREDLGLTLENNVGNPPLINLFSVEGGYSKYPEIHNGTITVVRPDIEWLGPRFIRGDANNDNKVSIADSIVILSYLFASGEAPFCFDAADINDDGVVNISDPIMLLSYQFSADRYPFTPFPDPGFDPTEDTLPGCGEAQSH